MLVHSFPSHHQENASKNMEYHKYFLWISCFSRI